MTLALRSALVVGLAVLANGCAIHFGPRIQGSGIAAIETREVSDFRHVKVRGSTDVKARIGGGLTDVRIEADDNLLEYVRTEVEGDTLIIEMEKGQNYSFRRGLNIEIDAPLLESLSIAGSADVDISGVHGERFAIAVSGSGDVVATGEVEQLDVSISGSGDVKLLELVAQDADVSISGSGDIGVHAERSLSASISGSGDVRYRGNPSIDGMRIRGSGSVEAD